MWFHLATHLHTPVQRVQVETSSRDFRDWKEYFRRFKNETTLEHYYLAQIAAEIRRGIVKKPLSVKLEQFLIKVVNQKKRPMVEKEGEEKRVSMSKKFWMNLTGVKKE